MAQRPEHAGKHGTLNGDETQEAEEEERPSAPGHAGAVAQETAFRPLTQMWTRLVEQQDLEIEMMLQMHGLLIFGVMVSTLRYAQFYIDLNEELHRENEPETADALREYYVALVPPRDQPEIGPEGLPVVSRYIHMRDVTIMSGGHKIKVPYWRGKIGEVDAFVVGATASE